MISDELKRKYENLVNYIRELGSAAVAFSGGVDSTFLLYAAKEALADNVIAITAFTDFIPMRERQESQDLCKELGVKQMILSPDILSVEEIVDNPPNRCYICKKLLFSNMCQLAKEHGMSAIMEGSNVSDMGDYRPGMVAISELGVHSPLRQADLSKSEIRQLSKHFGLPTWNKPSYACLASRVPYAEKISKEKLSMVEAAENRLIDQGFLQMRVRIHGDNLARIELDPAEFDRFMKDEIKDQIYQQLKEIGFTYITLDLKGYRTGSLNETILS